MHIPRFFLTPGDVCKIASGDAALSPIAPSTASLDLQECDSFKILQPGILNQVRNVLRLRSGDKLILLDSCGQMYHCSLISIEQKWLICQMQEMTVLQTEPQIKVTIGLPLLKGDRFEWALQKLTELGVYKVVPIKTARSVVKIDTIGDAKGVSNKVSRWQNILKEAAEQSERATIPNIVGPQKIEEFFDGFAAGGTTGAAFICTERLPVLPLRDILLDHICGRKDLFGTADKTISILVGPEGGLTEQEITLAQERGFMPVSLGHRILRAETAAIISVAQIIWALEK